MNLLFSVIMVLLFLGWLAAACKTGDTPMSIPRGNSRARPVYNHAYNENYEADSIEDIIAKASGAYVLLDPFQPGVPDKIALVKANNNEVGGYISIGTGEDWRDDFPLMKAYLVSAPWEEWAGEYFVKDTGPALLSVMYARIDKLAAWGCDWVEFDNMDWCFDLEARDKYGISLTEEEGIAYYQKLCRYAHAKGLKCMAKNVVMGSDDFDGVLYESFRNEKDWWDHAGAQKFLDAGKLVIVNHYNEPHPDEVYKEYMKAYDRGISYICESSRQKKYIHYNQ